VRAAAAIAAARGADAELARGDWRGPLHGIPVSLKDLIDVAGVPTTAASRLRAHHRAAADAEVVSRLRAAGAVIVGKCNLHEFAFGTTSEDSAWGPVHHPLDLRRSAGGSSGGSAAAVATGMSTVSVGTDTGGSIRIPAAACGCVGLKPTFGEIPLDGIVPLSRSLDHVGPIARTVNDTWIAYHALAGRPRTEPLHPDNRIAPGRVRLGLVRRHFTDMIDAEVRLAFDAELQRLQQAGATVVEAAVPHAADVAAVYLHIQLPEASAYHATALEASPGDYTAPVRLRLELGRYVLAEDYVRAQQGRAVLTAEVEAALAGVDALILPALPIPAPVLGATSVTVGHRSEPVRALMLRQTQLFDLTGHPALTIPCERSAGGLPCGWQLVGRRHATPDLLRLAYSLEASAV
jgi:aspartyl-tRNA(Asn)/glutamyl-tRNA(Gln) amidotransferase subunit A